MSHYSIDAFIESLPETAQEQAVQIHTLALEHGLTPEVKEAKSGFTVSYTTLKPKKTLAVFVQRKSGVKLRLYPRHLPQLVPFLQTLPPQMKEELQRASVCKRLINPDACNPKCPMGFAYILDGQVQQKCRHTAFMLSVTPETAPFILEFLIRDIRTPD